MSFLIDAADTISIKAITIAATASSWLRMTTVSGRQGYGIPAACQPGRFYLTDADGCDCIDAKRHTAPCKHILAVRLHEELARAQQTPKPSAVLAVPASITAARAKRYSEIFRED